MSIAINTGSGYTPEKMTDGFEPIKGRFHCGVNFARVEEYDGDIAELKGAKFFRYQLEIVDDPEYSGRRLFKRYNLSDTTTDKKGKTKAQQVADLLFTVGIEFLPSPNPDAEAYEKEYIANLEAACEHFVQLVLDVKAWHFPSSENPNERVQMHMIMGQATDEATQPKGSF